MVQSKTPEEHILYLIGQNRGTNNFISRSELIDLLRKYDCDFKLSFTKHEMARLLATKIGYDELEKVANVGMPSINFQQKFNLTNEQIKKLAKRNILHVTGKEGFRIYNKYCIANLYSVFDYFNYTEKELKNYL